MAQGETPQQSGFSDLEKKLADLNPTRADSGFVRKLGRRLDSMEGDREEKKTLWRRFIPVAATAGVVLTSTLIFQAHLKRQAAALSVGAKEPAAETAAEPGLPASGVGRVTGNFLPVSSGEFLRGASNGDIIGVEENGEPLREVHLEFEKQWRFHEPETGTNLEITWPEETVILVPIVTD